MRVHVCSRAHLAMYKQCMHVCSFSLSVTVSSSVSACLYAESLGFAARSPNRLSVGNWNLFQLGNSGKMMFVHTSVRLVHEQGDGSRSMTVT